MATDLLRQSSYPRVGRPPTSVVNDATDGSNLIDSLKSARMQNVAFQPHLSSLQPGWKPGENSAGDDQVPGAITGDCTCHEGGPAIFNGRIFKAPLGLTRCTLLECFASRPALNLNIAYPYNANFEVQGTGMTTALSTFDAKGGVLLTTAGASGNQAALWPHEDVLVSAWNNIGWNTAKRLLFQTCFSMAAITNKIVVAGLALNFAATWTKEDDNDQLIVWFDPSVDAYMHYTYSIAGVDVSAILTNRNGTKLTVAPDTEYHVELGTDVNRHPYIIVNGVLYFVGSTALTALTTMKPLVAVEATSAAAVSLACRHIAMSMDL